MPAITPPIPVGTPTTNGDKITVSQYEANPTYIQRDVADFLARDWFIDDVLRPGPQVTGGAVVFRESAPTDGLSARPAEAIAPGEEYPFVVSQLGEAKVREVEKFGGKFEITDEAVRRNRLDEVEDGERGLAATILEKSHSVALNEVRNGLLNRDVPQTIAAPTGGHWADFDPDGDSPTARKLRPHAQIMIARKLMRDRHRGVNPDVLVLNDQEMLDLTINYDDPVGMFARIGVRLRATALWPAGEALLADSGRLGHLLFEQGLVIERVPERLQDKTTVKGSIIPVTVVKNPFAGMILTDLNEEA